MHEQEEISRNHAEALIMKMYSVLLVHKRHAQDKMSSFLQTPSMVSLRPELDEDDNVAYGSDDHKLPPIVREQQ